MFEKSVPGRGNVSHRSWVGVYLPCFRPARSPDREESTGQWPARKLLKGIGGKE